MKRQRPKGVLGIGLACIEAAATGRTEHVPTSADYSDDLVRRIHFEAGGGHGWRISALETPRDKPAPWKIVIVTGAPSWSEYWAPALAALPQNREMIVVDRPGFAGSEPFDCVPDIRIQAEALAPLLKAAPGQRILLVGQSYGAAIATLMAAANPKRVAGVVLLSSFLGVTGPTSRWLVDWGSRVLGLIPRDLRLPVLADGFPVGDGIAHHPFVVRRGRGEDGRNQVRVLRRPGLDVDADHLAYVLLGQPHQSSPLTSAKVSGAPYSECAITRSCSSCGSRSVNPAAGIGPVSSRTHRQRLPETSTSLATPEYMPSITVSP